MLGSHDSFHCPMGASDSYLSSLSVCALRTFDLRQEPDMGNLYVRICAGGAERSAFLPRLGNCRFEVFIPTFLEYRAFPCTVSDADLCIGRICNAMLGFHADNGYTLSGPITGRVLQIQLVHESDFHYFVTRQWRTSDCGKLWSLPKISDCQMSGRQIMKCGFVH